MGLGEVIREARLRAGLSQEQLGKKLGISDVAVSLWETGKTAPSGANTLRLIDVLGIDPALCLPGDIKYASPGVRLAPMYAAISAGHPREAVEADGFVPVPQTVIEEHPSGFFLRVSGECVNRVLPNGAYAFVDPDLEVSSGDLAAVLINGYDATIKRLHKTGNCIVLSPDSYDPSYTDQVFDYSRQGVDEVCAIGVVVWYTVPYSGRL